MGFIKFKESGKSFAPKISVGKTGMLSFNDGARKRFNLDNYKFCVLFFNPDTREVGIKLSNDSDEEGARKLRLRKSTGADIAAKSFFDYFGINTSSTTIHEVSTNNDDMIIINMNTGKKRRSAIDDSSNEKDASAENIDTQANLN